MFDGRFHNVMHNVDSVEVYGDCVVVTGCSRICDEIIQIACGGTLGI